MYRSVTALAFLGVLTPSSLHSQAEDDLPRALFVSSWQCPPGEIDQIMSSYDSLMIPIEQELVDEGVLAFSGMYRHEWGDEWNLNYYRGGQDRDAVFAAIQEVTSRVQERHPNAPGLFANCMDHKDNLYYYGPRTEPGEIVEGADLPTGLFISSWKCPRSSVVDIMAQYDSLSRPIEQELVNEGTFVGGGMFMHDWGDSWNIHWYRLGQDRNAVFDALDEINRRFNERHPDAPPGPIAECTAHKDNIYVWGPRTIPPAATAASNQ